MNDNTRTEATDESQDTSCSTELDYVSQTIPTIGMDQSEDLKTENLEDPMNNAQIWAESQIPSVQLDGSDQMDKHNDMEITDPETQSMESCQGHTNEDKEAKTADQESSNKARVQLA